MSTSLKAILAQIEQLPPAEVEQLRALLNNGVAPLASEDDGLRRRCRKCCDRYCVITGSGVHSRPSAPMRFSNNVN